MRPEVMRLEEKNEFNECVICHIKSLHFFHIKFGYNGAGA